MVSQRTQTNSNLRHFLISDLITTQTQFDNSHFTSVTNPFSDHFPSIQSLGERMSRSVNLIHNHDDQSDMGHSTRHFMDLLGAPTEPETGSNRLSLSLGSRVLDPSYRQRGLSQDFINQAYNNLVGSSGEDDCNPSGDYSFIGSSSFAPFSVGNSIYLRPAQSLLEEVINFGSKDIELSDVKRLFLSSRGLSTELRAEFLSNGFLFADKNDLQIKHSKLISLLEQVEGRYDDYCQKMDELISSFEMIAGEGAAKCYIALALQAMSRHFCSLRDAIISQIKIARKKLSPDLPKMGTGGFLSQLSRFDNGSNRMSLQQIGLLQGSHRQAWRPIRGLPETSVAILRAWLFEHFLHPYPNDSEKLTLASQTGLSKNQVSNWFINARVRLWKPMIEEMYKEEFGDSSVDTSGEGLADLADE